MKTNKIQKPFSIEAWKNGAKVETKDGRSARILCTDILGSFPIAAAIMYGDSEEDVLLFSADGRYCSEFEVGCDLVIVQEVKEAKV